MKRLSIVMIVVLLILSLCADTGQVICSEDEYESTGVIGFGPTGGELIEPGCIGSDGTGKIYVLDRATGQGSIYLESGIYLKPFVIPSSVNASDVKKKISGSMGNICYTTNDYVTVATTDGEIIIRLGTDVSSKLSIPTSACLMNDLTLLVNDISKGLVLFDSNGEFVRRPIIVGANGDLENIVDFDLSDDGQLATLTIIDNATGIKEFKPNEIKVTIFSKDFVKVSDFEIITTQERNPSRGSIRFDPEGNIFFYSVGSNISAKYSTNGEFISSIGNYLDSKAEVAVTGSRHFFVNSKSFYSTTPLGAYEREYGVFESRPMQFKNPTQITSCGSDGIAVLDTGRGDLQMFNEKGFSGAVELSFDTKNIISTNSDGQVVLYNPVKHQITAYECNGLEDDVLDIDVQIPEIDALTAGRNNEIWALSTSMGRITNINKGGVFISHFGSIGEEENEFIEPVDLLYGPDGNVYVLDAGAGFVKVFNKEGDFIRSIGQSLDINNPSSICLTQDVTLVISDTGNHMVHFFSVDGKHLYSKGEESPAFDKKTMDDYWTHLGTFASPTGLTSVGERLYILDTGNYRIQIYQKGVAIPELSVDTKALSFDPVRNGTHKKTFKISNNADGTINGTVETDVDWLRVSVDEFTGETIVNVICDVSMLPDWVQSSGSITVSSNGGEETIACTAVKQGDLIELQIDSNTAVINGASQFVEPAPVIHNGSTVVPLRFIGEALGASIDWEATEKRVTYRLKGKEVVLWVGVQEAKVNGKVVSMSVKPFIINGRTVVPLRFISEALGASVQWIGETRSINIYYPVNPLID